MRALHRAAANVERRSHPAFNTKSGAAGGRTDNVDDRIDRADLVKTHRLDRELVNRRFRLAEQLKRPAGAVFHAIIERCRADDAENRGERTVLRVLMRMGVRMLVLMFAGDRMLVRVAMLVIVCVCMGVRMFVCVAGRVPVLSGFVCLICFAVVRVLFVRRSGQDHIDFGPGDAAPTYLARLKTRADIQRGGVSPRVSKGTPASTSAPSSMSPLMPEKQSRYPMRIASGF